MTSVLYDAPGPKAIRRSRLTSWITGVIVVGALAYAAVTLGAQGFWGADRWDILNDPLVWLRLLEYLGQNLSAAAVAAVLAVLLGMVLSLLRMATTPLIRIPVTVVLEFFRGMPVLLMMLFALLAFPGIGSYWAVVGALVVYNGAIIGEALRSGLAALPRGQREAGLAIGLGSLQTRLLIEFPQAFRNMLPIIIAQLVVLVKDTALGYIVGMLALPRGGELLAEFYGRGQYFFSLFLVMVAMFLVVNLTLSAIARRIAGRGRRTRRAAPVEASAVQAESGALSGA